MAKEMKKVIQVPEGVVITFQNDILSVSGPKGKNERYLWYPGIIIDIHENEISIDSTSSKKSHKAMIGTFNSHINNMLKGITEGFEYNMKVVYSHFPMQLKVEGQKMLIGNFLGEKKARSANIIGETKVKASTDQVTITGINKEHVGQTAANIEQATKIKRYDPRVFQDGIYVVEKTT